MKTLDQIKERGSKAFDGGDAGLLCDPAHDELLALAASTGQEVEP